MGTIIIVALVSLAAVALGSYITITAVRLGAKNQAYKDAGLSPPPSTLESLFDRLTNRTRPEEQASGAAEEAPTKLTDIPKV